MRLSHRVTTPAEPEELWAVLEDPSRWPEFQVFLYRVEGTRGLVREGQHLLGTARGLPIRIPIDVRLVAKARHLGLTFYTLPGLREQVDHSVTRRRRGGSELRTSVVLEGPIAPLLVAPVYLATVMTTRLLGLRATREHRHNLGRADGTTGVA